MCIFIYTRNYLSFPKLKTVAQCSAKQAKSSSRQSKGPLDRVLQCLFLTLPFARLPTAETSRIDSTLFPPHPSPAAPIPTFPPSFNVVLPPPSLHSRSTPPASAPPRGTGRPRSHRYVPSHAVSFAFPSFPALQARFPRSSIGSWSADWTIPMRARWFRRGFLGFDGRRLDLVLLRVGSVVGSLIRRVRHRVDRMGRQVQMKFGCSIEDPRYIFVPCKSEPVRWISL